MEPTKPHEKTIFEKIVDREIPADIIYEDEKTMAFLDIAPSTHGHTLVIPKKPVVNIFDTDEETLDAVMHTVRKLAPAVRDAVGAKGVHVNSNNGEAAGQVVPHLHFHIIPRHDRSEFEFWPHAPNYAEGEAQTIVQKIHDALAG